MRNLIFVLLTLFVASCGKYDEGPNFSLRSKKARLVGTWELEKLYINGTLQSFSANSYTNLEIKKNKDTFTLNSFDALSGQYTVQFGEWEFVEKKEVLRLKYFDGSGTTIVHINDWEIKRLTNKELIFEFIDTGDKFRMEFNKL